MKANLLPGDESVGKEAARYIRFASAAYGMLMLKVHRPLRNYALHVAACSSFPRSGAGTKRAPVLGYYRVA